MKLFIDWNTGTWGDASDLVFVDATNETLNFLQDASDSEITQFAADEWHRQRGIEVD